MVTYVTYPINQEHTWTFVCAFSTYKTANIQTEKIRQ